MQVHGETRKTLHCSTVFIGKITCVANLFAYFLYSPKFPQLMQIIFIIIGE